MSGQQEAPKANHANGDVMMLTRKLVIMYISMPFTAPSQNNTKPFPSHVSQPLRAHAKFLWMMSL